MRVLFAGGGTAGHINPAIAVAKYIKDKNPESEILFAGTRRGLERELVAKAGFDIEYIDVVGFKRKISADNLKAIAKALGSYRESIKIIRDFRPDVVVGTGGYVSGPVLAAAARRKIPTLIHEQNVSPGITSKLLSKMVDVVCISFAQSREAFKNTKLTVHTGNPLRPELFEITREQARKALGIDERPFIVAFGGSLGAPRINEALLDFIIASKEKSGFQMLLAAGKAQYDEMSVAFLKNGITPKSMPSIELVPYIYNMDCALRAADLVISRAGAITISEINALGKPAILIPSPNVTGNHQEHNARALEVAGAAMVIKEEALASGALKKAIDRLIYNKETLAAMGENSKKMGISNGAQKIYSLICDLIKK